VTSVVTLDDRISAKQVLEDFYFREMEIMQVTMKAYTSVSLESKLEVCGCLQSLSQCVFRD